jgi:hypothetical protein
VAETFGAGCGCAACGAGSSSGQQSNRAASARLVSRRLGRSRPPTFGREPELGVGVTLQGGQVIEELRPLALLLLLELGDLARPATRDRYDSAVSPPLPATPSATAKHPTDLGLKRPSKSGDAHYEQDGHQDQRTDLPYWAPAVRVMVRRRGVQKEVRERDGHFVELDGSLQRARGSSSPDANEDSDRFNYMATLCRTSHGPTIHEVGKRCCSRPRPGVEVPYSPPCGAVRLEDW